MRNKIVKTFVTLVTIASMTTPAFAENIANQTADQIDDVVVEETTRGVEDVEFKGRITTEVTNRWLTIYFTYEEVPPMSDLEKEYNEYFAEKGINIALNNTLSDERVLNANWDSISDIDDSVLEIFAEKIRNIMLIESGANMVPLYRFYLSELPDGKMADDLSLAIKTVLFERKRNTNLTPAENAVLNGSTIVQNPKVISGPAFASSIVDENKNGLDDNTGAVIKTISLWGKKGYIMSENCTFKICIGSSFRIRDYINQMKANVGFFTGWDIPDGTEWYCGAMRRNVNVDEYITFSGDNITFIEQATKRDGVLADSLMETEWDSDRYITGDKKIDGNKYSSVNLVEAEETVDWEPYTVKIQ
jgi:hypothetical protein